MVATKHPVGTTTRKAHRNEVRLSELIDISLLYTCREVYNQALSVLYSYNKLHFPVLAKGLMLNKRQQASFSFLTHVSFDYSYKFSNHWGAFQTHVYWTTEVANHVDTTICKSIKQVADSCPVLKKLTLHIVSFPAFVHLTALAAHNICTTTTALSALASRLDMLEIVGMPAVGGARGVLQPRGKAGEGVIQDPYALNYSEFALLNSIAPWNGWELGLEEKVTYLPRLSIDWPGISVSQDFLERETLAASKESCRLYENEKRERDWDGEYMRVKTEWTTRVWYLKPMKGDGAAVQV